jgi:hypothetical protein
MVLELALAERLTYVRNGGLELGQGICRMVGLLGFEPRTKGFTFSKRFRSAWTISSPSRDLTNHAVGCGTL